jgi:nicotinate-nucleotide adenylyltransferase
MRIALFGGTFDPPHRGHIAIAKAAADRFALDQVLFAPTGLQPLKHDPATAFATRMELVAAACEADPRFAPSDIDAPRPDGSPNYTVDTLTTLAALHSNDELFNLVGADSLLNLPNWHQPARLLELAEWIVVTRPGYPLTNSDLAALRLSQAQLARIHILFGIAEDISATDLRTRLRHKDPCPDLLSPAVCGLIQSQALYSL